ncbi:MAG: response regulator [Bacteroidetes bacterium]|nr:response regulator [Bacteroidota bacterium]
MEKEENQLLSTGTIEAGIFSDRIKTVIILGNIITFVVLASSLIVIFIDFSNRNFFEQELIKAKELAERSVKVKEHFLANISHEIRTPMNAISGLTKILLRLSPSQKQKEYLEAIKASSDMLIVIINDILDLSKAQAGKMVFDRSEFRLTQLVSSITDLLHSKAEEKNLKLSTSVDDNIPEILIGDAVRLNQIILNLVSNSMKFTEEGEIDLNVEILEQKRGEVLLKFTVSDTGIGIPEEIMPVIFESFTQASTEITRKYGGTGLGLNIVKELVELQGGSIKVISKVNQGTEFSFSMLFPLAKQKLTDGFTSGTAINNISKTKLNGLNVLLVEDNMINQMVAQAVLNEFGCKTITADNGKAALEKIQKMKPDIILMDIQMPEMSGYEVTQIIRNEMPEPLCSIPIIAMTANAGKSDEKKCLDSGMDDFISKPFDENDLYNKLLYWSESKNAGIENPLFIEKPAIPGLFSSTRINPKTKADVINLFIELTPKAIKNMKKHNQEGNLKMLSNEAHKIRPSFSIIDNPNLESLLAQIEDLSKEGKTKEIISYTLVQLEKACEIAIEELRDELKQLQIS